METSMQLAPVAVWIVNSFHYNRKIFSPDLDFKPIKVCWWRESGGSQEENH